MKKENLINKFISAIRKAEPGLANQIITDDFNIEDDYLYCEMSYQIDDRIDRDSDEMISAEIEKELGGEYGVAVIRMDAFPDGFASYKVKIDK